MSEIGLSDFTFAALSHPCINLFNAHIQRGLRRSIIKRQSFRSPTTLQDRFPSFSCSSYFNLQALMIQHSKHIRRARSPPCVGVVFIDNDQGHTYNDLSTELSTTLLSDLDSQAAVRVTLRPSNNPILAPKVHE